MNLATTPCPWWCSTDHDRFRNHAHPLGEAHRIEVVAFQYAAEPPSISVMNHALQAPTVAAPRDGYLTEIQQRQAPGVVALLETLGHRDLAGLIRRAAELIKEVA